MGACANRTKNQRDAFLSERISAQSSFRRSFVLQDLLQAAAVQSVPLCTEALGTETGSRDDY